MDGYEYFGRLGGQALLEGRVRELQRIAGEKALF
jgi:hypothetical protein